MIEFLIQPSGLAMFLMFVALIMAMIKPLLRYSLIVFSLSALLVLACSTGTVASLLLSPLEYQYPVMEHPESHPQVNIIVVLTGGAHDDPGMALSSRVNTASAYRLLEAQHLYALCDCAIYLSGGDVAVKVMADILLSTGIDENKIIKDSNAVHTYNSAENLALILKDRAFYLITSAGHMPRAMGVMKKHGLTPIAVPTEFQLPQDFTKASVSLSPLHLFWSDLAVHEYVAIVWYKFTNKM